MERSSNLVQIYQCLNWKSVGRLSKPVLCQTEHASGHDRETQDSGSHHPVVPSPLVQEAGSDMGTDSQGRPDEEEADSTQDVHGSASASGDVESHGDGSGMERQKRTVRAPLRSRAFMVS